MFSMKVLNLTDKILIFFFQKSALARFDHLFLKKTYDQPNFKNFPEISNICIDSGDRFVFKTW